MANFSFMGAYSDLPPEKQAQLDKLKLHHLQLVRRRAAIKAQVAATGSGSPEVKEITKQLNEQEKIEKENIQSGFAAPQAQQTTVNESEQKSLLIPVIAIAATGIGAILLLKG